MKKLLLAFVLFAMSAGAQAAEDSGGRYYIPPTQFNAAMQVMDLGFANIFGLFRNSTGSYEYESAGKSVSNLKLAIDATSLIASDPENGRQLIDLLGGRLYPEIRFTTRDSVSFTEGKADIKGTLTVHGVSKPFTLTATLNQVGKSPGGGGMWTEEGRAIGLSMRGTFKRSDFGLADNPEMPNRFGDSVTLLLETQAIRQ